MTRQLSQAEFVARDAAPEGVRSYHFDRGGDAATADVRVMWAAGKPGSTGGAVDVALRTDDALVVTDIDGASSTYEPYRGVVHLTVTGSPVYVEGAVQDVDDGFLVSIDAPAQTSVGADIPVTFTVTDDGARGSTPVQFRVDDERRPVVVVARPGVAASKETVAAGGHAPGTRTVVAELSIRGVHAGRLASRGVPSTVLLTLDVTCTRLETRN